MMCCGMYKLMRDEEGMKKEASKAIHIHVER